LHIPTGTCVFPASVGAQAREAKEQHQGFFVQAVTQFRKTRIAVAPPAAGQVLTIATAIQLQIVPSSCSVHVTLILIKMYFVSTHEFVMDAIATGGKNDNEKRSR
jgi:hypothetical protein